MQYPLIGLAIVLLILAVALPYFVALPAFVITLLWILFIIVIIVIVLEYFGITGRGRNTGI